MGTFIRSYLKFGPAGQEMSFKNKFTMDDGRRSTTIDELMEDG